MGGNTEREKSFPEKEDCFSHLDMEGITEADYMHSIKVCKNFEIKN